MAGNRKAIDKGRKFSNYAVAISKKLLSKIFIWQAIVKGRSVSTEGPFFLQCNEEVIHEPNKFQVNYSFKLLSLKRLLLNTVHTSINYKVSIFSKASFHFNIFQCPLQYCHIT